MKVIKMVVEFEYNDYDMHGGDSDVEGKEWFLENILTSDKGNLRLHCNEMGDTLGCIKVNEILSTRSL